MRNKAAEENGLPKVLDADPDDVPHMPFDAEEKAEALRRNPRLAVPVVAAEPAEPVERPYVNKIRILQSSVPAYHNAWYQKEQARKAREKQEREEKERLEEEMKLAQGSEKHEGADQSTDAIPATNNVQTTIDTRSNSQRELTEAERAENLRRLKPHSRNAPKLDDGAIKPTSLTPVPSKKPKATKWQFGIRSRNQPLEALGCIYRALQKLGAEWIVPPSHRSNAKDIDSDEDDGKYDTNWETPCSIKVSNDHSANFTGDDDQDGGELHHADSMINDNSSFATDVRFRPREKGSQYDLPEDPWVIHVRWQKDGVYPPGSIHSGTTNSSQTNLRRTSIASLSSTGSSGPTQEHSAATAGTSKDIESNKAESMDDGRKERLENIVMHLDIQLYEMEAGVYLVDFKCAGYETQDGMIIEDKDVTSPFPFLDLCSKLIIQLAEAD